MVLILSLNPLHLQRYKLFAYWILLMRVIGFYIKFTLN